MSLKAAKFRPGRLSTWTPQITTSGPSINLWSGRHFEQLSVRLGEGGFVVGYAFSAFRIFRGIGTLMDPQTREEVWLYYDMLSIQVIASI
jgi:hypothetical protein